MDYNIAEFKKYEGIWFA